MRWALELGLSSFLSFDMWGTTVSELRRTGSKGARAKLERSECDSAPAEGGTHPQPVDSNGYAVGSPYSCLPSKTGLLVEAMS